METWYGMIFIIKAGKTIIQKLCELKLAEGDNKTFLPSQLAGAKSHWLIFGQSQLELLPHICRLQNVCLSTGKSILAYGRIKYLS